MCVCMCVYVCVCVCFVVCFQILRCICVFKNDFYNVPVQSKGVMKMLTWHHFLSDTHCSVLSHCEQSPNDLLM